MHKYLLITITIVLPSVAFSSGEKTAAPAADGPALYQQYCARCHGSLEETWIPDRRPSRITSAIRTLGRMSSVRHLTQVQIEAIADVLKSDDMTLNGP